MQYNFGKGIKTNHIPTKVIERTLQGHMRRVNKFNHKLMLSGESNKNKPF